MTRGLWLLGCVAAGVAQAQTQTQDQAPAATQQQNPSPGAAGAPPAGTQQPATVFSPDRTNLLGDAGGARTALARVGVTVGLQESGDVFANLTGGQRRTADYAGLTTASLGVDLATAVGWTGATFNVSALQIHGRSLQSDALLNLQPPSGLAAIRSTRLWELWVQQAFADGRLDIKLGQQSIDQEFVFSGFGGTFLNNSMGWPVLPAADLYAGGPTYPYSSLAARVRARLGAVTVLAAVADDNPVGGPFGGPQDSAGALSGTRFGLDTGALFIAEAQYATTVGGHTGFYKFGGWYDTASFPDQRTDTLGRSLADPRSSGVGRMRRGDFAFYGIADQTVWQPDPRGARALGVFARALAAPGDRNLVQFALTAGLVLKAPFEGRDNDSTGLGFGIARIGDAARRYDADVATFGGARYPKRSAETYVELTYQYQIAGWWQVQPDAQYVFQPGGGVPDPSRAGKRIGDEAILGLRTNITF